MGGYYISVNIKTSDNAPFVRDLLTTVFTERRLYCPSAVKQPLPSSPRMRTNCRMAMDWYGVLVSGASGTGWVTVYVEDWQDSGFLAKRLSQSVGAPVLELWVADDIHWGYNYYEGGEVRDRFADDPSQVAESDAEASACMAGQCRDIWPHPESPARHSSTAILHEAQASGRPVRGRADRCRRAGGRPAVRACLHRLRLLSSMTIPKTTRRIWRTGRSSATSPSSRRQGRETLSE